MSGHTYTHTYTYDNYYNPRCAHAHRGLINIHKILSPINLELLKAFVAPGLKYQFVSSIKY